MPTRFWEYQRASEYYRNRAAQLRQSQTPRAPERVAFAATPYQPTMPAPSAQSALPAGRALPAWATNPFAQAAPPDTNPAGSMLTQYTVPTPLSQQNLYGPTLVAQERAAQQQLGYDPYSQWHNREGNVTPGSLLMGLMNVGTQTVGIPLLGALTAAVAPGQQVDTSGGLGDIYNQWQAIEHARAPVFALQIGPVNLSEKWLSENFLADPFFWTGIGATAMAGKATKLAAAGKLADAARWSKAANLVNAAETATSPLSWLGRGSEALLTGSRMARIGEGLAPDVLEALQRIGPHLPSNIAEALMTRPLAARGQEILSLAQEYAPQVAYGLRNQLPAFASRMFRGEGAQQAADIAGRGLGALSFASTIQPRIAQAGVTGATGLIGGLAGGIPKMLGREIPQGIEALARAFGPEVADRLVAQGPEAIQRAWATKGLGQIVGSPFSAVGRSLAGNLGDITGLERLSARAAANQIAGRPQGVYAQGGAPISAAKLEAAFRETPAEAEKRGGALWQSVKADYAGMKLLVTPAVPDAQLTTIGNPRNATRLQPYDWMWQKGNEYYVNAEDGRPKRLAATEQDPAMAEQEKIRQSYLDQQTVRPPTVEAEAPGAQRQRTVEEILAKIDASGSPRGTSVQQGNVFTIKGSHGQTLAEIEVTERDILVNMDPVVSTDKFRTYGPEQIEDFVTGYLGLRPRGSASGIGAAAAQEWEAIYEQIDDIRHKLLSGALAPAPPIAPVAETVAPEVGARVPELGARAEAPAQPVAPTSVGARVAATLKPIGASSINEGDRVMILYGGSDSEAGATGKISELRGWDFDLGKKVGRWVFVWIDTDANGKPVNRRISMNTRGLGKMKGEIDYGEVTTQRLAPPPPVAPERGVGTEEAPSAPAEGGGPVSLKQARAAGTIQGDSPGRVGWKLHLAVSPENARAVYDWLQANTLLFKYGRSSGQEGKDFTVYLGSRDLAQEWANKISVTLGDKLGAPRGDTLETDALLADGVMGRFDAADMSDYGQYGFAGDGLPWRTDDISNWTYGDRAARAQLQQDASGRARRDLTKRYGEFFAGAAPAARPEVPAVTPEAGPGAVGQWRGGAGSGILVTGDTVRVAQNYEKFAPFSKSEWPSDDQAQRAFIEKVAGRKLNDFEYGLMGQHVDAAIADQARQMGITEATVPARPSAPAPEMGVRTEEGAAPAETAAAAVETGETAAGVPAAVGAAPKAAVDEPVDTADADETVAVRTEPATRQINVSIGNAALDMEARVWGSEGLLSLALESGTKRVDMLVENWPADPATQSATIRQRFTGANDTEVQALVNLANKAIARARATEIPSAYGEAATTGRPVPAPEPVGGEPEAPGAPPAGPPTQPPSQPPAPPVQPPVPPPVQPPVPPPVQPPAVPPTQPPPPSARVPPTQPPAQPPQGPYTPSNPPPTPAVRLPPSATTPTGERVFADKMTLDQALAQLDDKIKKNIGLTASKVREVFREIGQSQAEAVSQRPLLHGDLRKLYEADDMGRAWVQRIGDPNRTRVALEDVLQNYDQYDLTGRQEEAARAFGPIMRDFLRVNRENGIEVNDLTVPDPDNPALPTPIQYILRQAIGFRNEVTGDLDLYQVYSSGKVHPVMPASYQNPRTYATKEEAIAAGGVYMDTIEALRGGILQMYRKVGDVRMGEYVKREIAPLHEKVQSHEVELPVPGVMGKGFDSNNKDVILIRKALGMTGVDELKVLGQIVARMNDLPRMMLATFDVSPALLQGQILLAYRPAAWAKAVGLGLLNFFPGSEERYQKFLAQPDIAKLVRETANFGPQLSMAEPGRMVQESGLVTGNPITGRAWTGNEGPIAKGIRKFGENYDRTLTAARLLTLSSLWRDTMTDKEKFDTVSFVNELTGTVSYARTSASETQRVWENALLFSPRYTRATLALLSDVARGGIRGKQAKLALGRWAGAGVILYALICKALGQKPEFDPRKGGKWLSFEIAGTNVGIGGAVYSTLRTGSKMAAEVVAGQPGEAVNTLKKYLLSRGAPMTSTLYKFLMREDYIGRPLDTLPELGKDWLKTNLVPTWVQAMLEQGAISDPNARPGEGAVAGLTGIAGLRAYPVSPADERDAARDQVAQEWFGKPYGELNTTQRMRVNTESPEVVQKIAAAQQTSTERKNVYSLFWNDVTSVRKQYDDEIGLLTAQLEAGTLGGNDYRKAVQQRELLRAKVPEQLRGTAQYSGKVTAGDEEAATTPVDLFLNEYYNISAKYTDAATGVGDPVSIVRARDLLKKAYDPEVVVEAMAYINRNRAPEYVQAQTEYAEYQAIPQFLGLNRAQQDAVNRASRTIRSWRQQNPYVSSAATKAAYARYDPEGYRLYVLSSRLTNPARKRFWAAHPLLSKYYSDLTGEELEANPFA